MKIFSRAESPSLIERYMANVERTKTEIADIENNIPKKRMRIEKLALAADDGDATARAEIDKLYDQIETDRRDIEIKNAVLKRAVADLDKERAAKQASDDQLAMANLLKLLAKRETFAKDIERGFRIAAEGIAGITDINRKAAGAWRSTWPGGFEALIGADQSYTRPSPGEILARRVQTGGYTPAPGLAEFVRQTLGHLCAEYQIRIPEPAYSTTRDPYFPGLTASYAAVTTRLKKMFTEQASEPLPPAEPLPERETEQPLPPDEPSQTSTLPAEPHGPISDEEIAQANKDGTAQYRPGWALSGREWVKGEAYGKKPAATVAPGTDFNVFDGGDI
ncbi:hypothetical protein [Hyphomicrobium sp. ghe19]|uniref:hypothetical protein n=1 Tax=Hyphomicrobium sp. ghe19 TaxID=2682968 RepID=UPI001366FE10|nr:hypothetical protein HYPP_02379 [Hyphomicrobium sp. ghe19]